MKKILLLAVLALAVPTAMFAGSSVDYTNSGGTLSSSSAGLSASGSVVLAANDLSRGGLLTGSDLGGVSLGAATEGAIVQLTGNTGNGLFNRHTRFSSEDANSSAMAAEPSSLSLLGTALIGLAGLVHRKFNN
jgi:hypothetical protein